MHLFYFLGTFTPLIFIVSNVSRKCMKSELRVLLGHSIHVIYYKNENKTFLTVVSGLSSTKRVSVPFVVLGLNFETEN